MRTALSLASLTGKPFRIYNLRAGRSKPGLRPQHMLAAKAAAAITGGSIEGCTEGSETLTYLPGRTRPGRYAFEVGTAGSVTLVLQTILAPLAFADRSSSVTLKGGTHVPWSPPSDYIEKVFLPALYGMGLRSGFLTRSRGYYPGGGGTVESSISPASTPLKPLLVTERGRLLYLRITSAVSNLPLSIAERQMKSATSLLSDYSGAIETEIIEAPSPGTGTSVFILAVFEKTRAGFSALGARGKRAEEVGAEAARAFLQYMLTGAALDHHLSDQMLIYMALAEGESSFTASRITGHLLTNIHTIEQFLPVVFKVAGVAGDKGAVSVKGAGLEALRISG